jgi:hypothetical protein
LLFNCIFDKAENLSPYFYLNVDGEIENVTVICIRIAFICEDNQSTFSFRNRDTSVYNKNNPEIITHYISPYTFFKGICRQCEISEAGLMNLTRNTPIVLFSKLYDNKSSNYKMIYNHLCKNINKRNKAYMTQLFKEFNNIDNTHLKSKYYFAISCMEYINIEYYRNCYDIVTPIIDEIHSFTCKRDFEYIQNYNEKSVEIFNLRDSEPYNNLELSKFSERLKMIYNIARYEIIMIAVNTGYSQGNYDIENLFLYEELNSILVTDFENVKHIPKYENIQNNWFFLEENDFKQEKDAFRVLKEILEDIYNTHYQDNDENSDHYKWLKNIDQEDVTIIYNLHTFRKFATAESNPSIFEMYLNRRRDDYLYNGSLEIDTKNTNTFIHCISSLFCKVV